MKYKPEVFRLMKIIEQQKRALELTREPSYVLGERTIEGSQNASKKKTKEGRSINERFNKLVKACMDEERKVDKRFNKLEAKIKQLTKRVDTLHSRLGNKK